ncbi:MAG TPA: serine hydrolase domain-containing protein [Vicinamibacterales bacterium]|nr:serine hydrolase domain-containing protein [Vicinamibacterales bacterium]
MALSIARVRRVLAIELPATIGSLVIAFGQSPETQTRVDKIFSKWTNSTPGCAVGAAVDGQQVVSAAYGMADLEREVKNTPETIFEGGSVSKQFTAAAVLLLAREGKLSLDDPVRKYIPEIPDYGAPLRIRHMLNHTSGLRDWGSVESIAGWPRTSRVYTQAHVLEILSRQRAINFPSGTRYSYSNSGYNLAAMLVARVSGMPFAEFTKTRLFQPLGMMHTSWRDDHTRIVKNRAVAYADQKDGFHIDMPFENVYGNGGLLTTVGDLLKWNENFDAPRIGDRSFIAEQQQPGRFNDGRPHGYALGLMVDTYKGVRQVDHSGSTAGYRAHLGRYPDQHVSVAVLCNVTSGGATESAHAVAEIYLGDRLKPATVKAAYSLSEAEGKRLTGLYKDIERGLPTTIAYDKNGLHVDRDEESDERDTALLAMSPTRFVTASNQTWEFDTSGRVRVTDAYGTVDTLQRVDASKRAPEQGKALTGTYTSDEAEMTLTVAIDGASLAIKRRPDKVTKLTPVYADAFSADTLGLVIFRREGSGRVTSLSVVQDRVWDMRFTRQPTVTSTRQDVAGGAKAPPLRVGLLWRPFRAAVGGGSISR